MISPVILAGGQGRRLWPLSQPSLPKPFLRLPGQDSTLLQQTISRLKPLPQARAPLIVGNSLHAARLRSEARAADVMARFLLEPEPRGTAPAICAAALLLEQEGFDEPMLVLPSDHIVSGAALFAEAVASGSPLAEQGYLVTFSICPTYAATGYGYLRHAEPLGGTGLFCVDRFVEKPDAATAESYLEDGDFAWNSGIFMFRPSVLLAAAARLEPEMLAACRAALGTHGLHESRMLDSAGFARTRDVSIDRAIMERSSNIATVLARFAWSDAGDWDAIRLAAGQDASGNLIDGNAVMEGGANSLLYSEGPPLIGIGLENMIAVATPEAVLVAPRSRAQDVKDASGLIKRLKRRKSSGLWHDERPWGSYDVLRNGSGYKVKELNVEPHGVLSLQRHRHRAEHWVCVAGRGMARTGEDTISISPGSFVFVPQGALHRLVNTGNETLRIVEVQIGADTAEDDIERLEDAYGRV